ncbi:protein translocase subunit SecF [Spelaeicoccus albus]|uniref:Protein translocase subunit SecF n=1 Tax=Spelaeicoccus albus TaxID=1280376 RepID=A0A7Z0D4D4_9MICO|nr:protein translocase subunit SecF [Spelaeicoccus albus]NYI68651.1 preprotein translocase subunit SecF [Spelaeicoccus albus]
MAANFASWGNDLHSGKRSIPYVGRRKLWLTISIIAVVASILVPIISGGFNLSIDFKGGSEFQISNVSNNSESIGTKAVKSAAKNADPRVARAGQSGVRIETNQLGDSATERVRDALMDAYHVKSKDVTSNFIGPTWGSDVTAKMLRALIIFVVLAAAGMALYFRTWKMSVSAIASVFQVMVVSAGIYAVTGFEVSPTTIVGFLTVLSFSLYDTVVVFDKIRENTTSFERNRHFTFLELVNLGANQTTVRSINTAVVGALPVAAILFIGTIWLGAGTLTDISLSLFIGIIVAAASTLFVATPMYAWLRQSEPAVIKQRHKIRHLREKEGITAPPVMEDDKSMLELIDPEEQEREDKADEKPAPARSRPWELEGVEFETPPEDDDSSPGASGRGTITQQKTAKRTGRSGSDTTGSSNSGASRSAGGQSGRTPAPRRRRKGGSRRGRG